VVDQLSVAAELVVAVTLAPRAVNRRHANMTGILDRKSTVSPSGRYEDLLRREPGESHLLAIGF